jgi:hypothetical protein
VQAPHSTENADENIKFPLLQKCIKLGGSITESERQAKKNPTPVRMLGYLFV